MQFSSLLFVQLPAFLSNLTNPSASTSVVTSPTSATSASINAMAAQQKFELPPLPYEYNVKRCFRFKECKLIINKALEPYISEQIMKLHHSKHHQV
jgi:hypothetical protein